MASDSTGVGRGTDAWFATTHWSVVLSARDRGAPRSAEALEKLCRAYWFPLYAYVRRQGHSAADAQDLTQEFFARLLHKNYLRSVAREKGKFRTFLLVALKRFLADEWDRARTLKRGGGRVQFSLDTTAAEQRYAAESQAASTAEEIYERRWALTLLESALQRLQARYGAAGKADEFEGLKAFLTAERGAIAYDEAAARCGLSEGAARVAVHRLRRAFREVFREEIAHTVDRPEDIDEEVRYLLRLFSR
jgi:RNA polymerase sigma factor (sigma-70 family)